VLLSDGGTMGFVTLPNPSAVFADTGLGGLVVVPFGAIRANLEASPAVAPVCLMFNALLLGVFAGEV